MHKEKSLKRIGLLILCNFLIQISFSQENYVPGYIIKNSSDTLHGFIDYRDWIVNPREVNFKVNYGDTPSTFRPTDILEFGVQNEVYEGGIINTEVSDIKPDKLSQDPALTIKVDTAFLKALVKGEKSLYSYENAEQKVNFYIKKGSSFELLIFKRYTVSKYDKLLINEDKRYLGQLNLYLKDCSSISSRLENTSYIQKNLVSLFRHYYNCTSTAPSFQATRKKIHAQFGILAGASFTNIKFSKMNNSFYALNKSDYKLSSNMAAGIFLDLMMPGNQGKWSIYNELLYSSYAFDGSFKYIQSPQYTTTTSTELGFNYLKINNLLRYKYPVRQMYLFLNAGLSNGMAISETNHQKIVMQNPAYEQVSEGVAYYDPRHFEQGYILGTGIKRKALSLELRFEKGNGITRNPALNSTTRYYLLLGYHF